MAMLTEKHKILTIEGFKEIKNLVVGDVVIGTNKKEIKILKVITPKKKKANIIGKLKEDGILIYK